jgi:hypothetical protein
MPTIEEHRQDATRPEADSRGSRQFRAQFDEDLSRVLDLDTWRPGGDLAQEYPRIERQVREALAQEDEVQRWTRMHIFPKLFEPVPGGPPNAGVFRADWDVLQGIHRGLLFNGGVEACDGTVQVHDTLPLTIYQVGVSLVSYRGDRGTWQQRLFRRDLLERGAQEAEVLRFLEERARRAALNHATPSDRLGELARNTVMQYAERAILRYRSNAVWRMGHGNPITYELLTGADLLELMVAGTRVLRELIEGHRKFVFVASEPREQVLLTIGQALPPLHYAIFCTLEERLRAWFHQSRFTLEAPEGLLWDGERIPAAEWIPRFLERVAAQVVVGVYRATRTAPPQLFYAHVDHAHLAAHIVLADSMFQEQRGFPLLIDLAHHVCQAVFSGSLRYLTETAYAAAGAPWRYFSERTTRER